MLYCGMRGRPRDVEILWHVACRSDGFENWRIDCCVDCVIVGSRKVGGRSGAGWGVIDAEIYQSMVSSLTRGTTVVRDRCCYRWPGHRPPQRPFCPSALSRGSHGTISCSVAENVVGKNFVRLWPPRAWCGRGLGSCSFSLHLPVTRGETLGALVSAAVSASRAANLVINCRHRIFIWLREFGCGEGSEEKKIAAYKVAKRMLMCAEARSSAACLWRRCRLF